MATWHFRGSAHHVKRQAARLGVAPTLADRAAKNVEAHRIGTLAGQLCEPDQRGPKGTGGDSAIAGPELAQVKGTLGQCEQELEKLHALAAAAAAIVDEAHAAFGLEPPARAFRVQCDFDPDPPPAAA